MPRIELTNSVVGTRIFASASVSRLPQRALFLSQRNAKTRKVAPTAVGTRRAAYQDNYQILIGAEAPRRPPYRLLSSCSPVLYPLRLFACPLREDNPNRADAPRRRPYRLLFSCLILLFTPREVLTSDVNPRMRVKLPFLFFVFCYLSFVPPLSFL